MKLFNKCEVKELQFLKQVKANIKNKIKTISKTKTS